MSPIETWLGPSDPLPIWTGNILSAYTKRLSAPDEIDADQLEVYAPDIMRKQRRPTSWVPASHINQALAELRICRPLPALARSWNWPHYLGAFNFAHGGLRLRQSIPVDLDIAARLRFGFDQLLGSPSQRINSDPTRLLRSRYAFPAYRRRRTKLNRLAGACRNVAIFATSRHFTYRPCPSFRKFCIALRSNKIVFERDR